MRALWRRSRRSAVVRAPGGARAKKILFLVTEDHYFWSHRLPLARAAKGAGYDVVVATRVSDHGARIEQEGLRVVPIQLSRGSKNPLRELRAMRELVEVYRREKPDLVHHVAVKPVLYGSAAAHLSGVGATVNALAGMGYVFSSDLPLARALRPFVVRAYRLALNRRGSSLLLQNPDDAALLRRVGVVHEDTALTIVRGSGVDVDLFAATPEPGGPPLVVLPARMLVDKGVVEFVEAARLLRQRGTVARFALVGSGDDANPTAIADRQLRAWAKEGVVEWWGFRSDMAAVLASANLVCLPSYREGLPKALLEAAACARAIVATDVPGCREIVRDGDNGLLVPPRDAASLARALERLLVDPELRARMGARGRAIAVAEFRTETVVEATLALYASLLAA